MFNGQGCSENELFTHTSSYRVQFLKMAQVPKMCITLICAVRGLPCGQCAYGHTLAFQANNKFVLYPYYTSNKHIIQC